MNTPEREPRHSRPAKTRAFVSITASPAAAAAWLLGITLLVRAVSFVPSMINPDESVFALAARELLDGHLPYLTLFDNKPVGSTLILGLTFRLLGQGIFAVRLIGALSVWLSAILIGATARRGGMAAFDAFLCGVLYIAFASTMGGFATLTEILLTPFTVGAVMLLQQMSAESRFRKRLLLTCCAGLSCGGAILVKIVPIVPGFAVAGLILLMLLLRRDLSLAAGMLLALVFALFSLLPMAAAGAVYAGNGALAEFLYSNFGFARAYSSIHPGLMASAQRLGTMLDSLWPLLALAVMGLAAFARRWRHKQKRVPLLLIAVVWLLGELVAASGSLHFYPHYFLTALPPLCLLAAAGIDALAAFLAAPHSRARATALLFGIASVIPVERTQVDALRELSAGDLPRHIAHVIAGADRRHAPTLFVTNYQLSVLYSLTGAPLPPTRYAVPPHLFSRQSAMIQANPSTEVARVLGSRPEFIVIDNTDKLPEWATMQLRDTLTQSYSLIDRRGSVDVYQVSARPVAPGTGPAA